MTPLVTVTLVMRSTRITFEFHSWSLCVRFVRWRRRQLLRLLPIRRRGAEAPAVVFHQPIVRPNACASGDEVDVGIGERRELYAGQMNHVRGRHKVFR